MVEGFDALKARLDEIVEEVSSDDISLDDALALYEEAVSIGIAACDASELDIPEEEADEEAAEESAEGAEDAADAAVAAESADAVEADAATDVPAPEDPEQEGPSF